MTDDMYHDQPAREYYTAQELADLALEWGANATVVSDDDSVMIVLDHDGAVLQLDLGLPRQFYADVVCRGWVTVPSAPHRFCDRLNRLPYLGTFSVLYGENDLPEMNDGEFTLRAVMIIDFEHYTSRSDVFLDVLVFWHGLVLLQEAVVHGERVLEHFDFERLSGGVNRWWFGIE